MPDVTLKSDDKPVAFPVPKPFPIPKIDFAKIKAVTLFDGKSFDGWDGSRSAFRLEDGATDGPVGTPGSPAELRVTGCPRDTARFSPDCSAQRFLKEPRHLL